MIRSTMNGELFFVFALSTTKQSGLTAVSEMLRQKFAGAQSNLRFESDGFKDQRGQLGRWSKRRIAILAATLKLVPVNLRRLKTNKSTNPKFGHVITHKASSNSGGALKLPRNRREIFV